MAKLPAAAAVSSLSSSLPTRRPSCFPSPICANCMCCRPFVATTKFRCRKYARVLTMSQEQLGSSRPLLDRDFMTNGSTCSFGTRQSYLMFRKGSTGFAGEFEMALARIERDKQGTPIRLFPFSRTSTAAVDKPRTVVIDPRLSFGRPVISKVAVPTGIILIVSATAIHLPKWRGIMASRSRNRRSAQVRAAACRLKRQQYSSSIAGPGAAGSMRNAR